MDIGPELRVIQVDLELVVPLTELEEPANEELEDIEED